MEQIFYLFYRERPYIGYISLRSLDVTLWAVKGVKLQFVRLFAAALGLFLWSWRPIIRGRSSTLLILYESGIDSVSVTFPWEDLSWLGRC
jgi:hypothetical protein